MLRKLMKHEFRATARIMLPIYLALVGVTVLAKLSFGVMDREDVNWFLELVSGLIIAVFFMSLFALSIGVLALVMQSFQKSFLSDEGYLTMTLPVSTHKLLSSKLIVGIVWYFATGIVMLLAILAVSLSGPDWVEFLGGFRGLLSEIFRVVGAGHVNYLAHGIALVLEVLLIGVLALALLSLLGYASMAMGYSFDKGKKFWCFVFAFAFYFGLQLLAFFLLFLVANNGSWDILVNSNSLTLVHLFLLSAAAAEAVVGVGFYFLTHYFLTHRLNLE